MKEGSIIYCIKDLEYLWELDDKIDIEQFTGDEVLVFYPKNTVVISNIKGKEYIIDSVFNNSIYITSEDNTTPYNVYGIQLNIFNTHFIYGKNYRKEKLDKLNSI